ncbi:MAG: alcohol dehydrogenase catalytic domain-containing protein [Gammaproteobacteria bacterium]|nr:alcohol dehydrogenase catalytic domain-containing protein [Gammaproteobacteria bacterium]
MKTRAMLLTENGPPENLTLTEVDIGDTGEHDVVVDMKAAGTSFPDVLMVAGEYQFKPDLPFVPGQEGAGIVREVGSAVTRVKPGDRVMTSHRTGAFAERAILPESRVTLIPGNIDFVTAASFRSNYATALLAMQRARLQPGEVLLVHGAAGGVGMAAVHIGKYLGRTRHRYGRRRREARDRQGQGADEIINYTHGFREQVKALTG